jgi:hypothetical protein
MKVRMKLRPLYVVQMQWLIISLFYVVWDSKERALIIAIPFMEVFVQWKQR